MVTKKISRIAAGDTGFVAASRPPHWTSMQSDGISKDFRSWRKNKRK
jgi:hypothetical protein